MPQKFYTTVSRYVDGTYVHASVEQPALVLFPDHLHIKLDKAGNPEDKTLSPFKEAPPKVEKLAAPYAEVRRGPPVQGKHASSGKRPSDVDPGQ